MKKVVSNPPKKGKKYVEKVDDKQKTLDNYVKKP
jgi:hypothetical protein